MRLSWSSSVPTVRGNAAGEAAGGVEVYSNRAAGATGPAGGHVRAPRVSLGDDVLATLGVRLGGAGRTLTLGPAQPRGDRLGLGATTARTALASILARRAA